MPIQLAPNLVMRGRSSRSGAHLCGAEVFDDSDLVACSEGGSKGVRSRIAKSRTLLDLIGDGQVGNLGGRAHAP
jgi:hypothetical protein